MKLSLLVPSMRPTFLDQGTAAMVRTPAYRTSVEFIMLNDNDRLSIGKKMERLVEMSTGQYIMWLADDDLLAPRALPLILDNLGGKRKQGVSYNVVLYPQKSAGLTCKIHPSFATTALDWDGDFQLRPWHPLVPTRRDLYENLTYPDHSYGEDHELIEQMIPHLEPERWGYIDDSLYIAFPRH